MSLITCAESDLPRSLFAVIPCPGNPANLLALGEVSANMTKRRIKIILFTGAVLFICLISLVTYLATKTGFFKGDDTRQYRSFDVSPDGRQIVFAAAGHGGNDLYLLNLITRHVTRLTDTPIYENHPSFSPDGRSIVYEVASRLDGQPHLAVRSLDGAFVRQITSGKAATDIFPSFSHDGEKITFTRAQTYVAGTQSDLPGDDLDIYVVNRNGSGLKCLTHERYHGVIQPRFSPDDRSIIFERWIRLPHYDMVSHISMVDADGRSPIREIEHYGWFDTRPAFFPNGRKIVFVSDMKKRYSYDLYQMSLDTKVPVALTARGYGVGNPVVAPDSLSIFYLGGDETELWQVNSDGSHAHQVADSSLFSDPMHWKPKTK